MDCKNSYLETKRLKHSVLRLAMKELNEVSDLEITCEDVKVGRTIKGFKFTFREKTQSQLTKGDAHKQIEMDA